MNYSGFDKDLGGKGEMIHGNFTIVVKDKTEGEGLKLQINHMYEGHLPNELTTL